MIVPPYAIVDAPVADMRSGPNDAAELVDQLHYHEMPRVLATRNGWHYVQAQDHYFGWVHAHAVQVMPGGGGRCVGMTHAALRSAPDPDAAIVGWLPAGTPIPDQQIPEPPNGWIRVPSRSLELADGVRDAYLSLGDVVSLSEMPHRAPTAADLLATAEAFIGVPYLWGGTSALGMDCSGYVQQVYRLNGIQLDRDADQQATEGRSVEAPAPGDLLFFGSDTRITHVALATGERTFLHAPQSGGAVERSQLSPERTLRAIRRYLPDPR